MAELPASHSSSIPQNHASKPRVDYLDGLRGWACFAILIYHLVFNLLALSAPGLAFDTTHFVNDASHGRILDLLYGLFASTVVNGHLALYVFFVLSGYTLSMAHLNPQKNTLPAAAASRYFRMMIPIFYTSLLIYVLWKLDLFFNIRATANSGLDKTDWLRFTYGSSTTLKDFAYFAFYGVFFRYDWFGSYNVVLWCIQTQFVGSFLVFGFLALFRRTSNVPWALATLLTLALLDSQPMLACFMCGYLLAELNARFALSQRTHRRSVELALVLGLIGAFILTEQNHLGGDRVACLVASFVVALVSFSRALRSFFSSTALKFLGRISFSLYLVQIPVICSWSCYWFIKLPKTGVAHTTGIVFILLTTVVIALSVSAALLPLDGLTNALSKKLGALLLNTPSNAEAKERANLGAGPARPGKVFGRFPISS
jgi:peptidoglycan/LPS O-acetylase OafA/YrhL